jgi:hypothetical protein
LMCIYSLHSFCDGCGDCADEDLQGADLGWMLEKRLI